MSDQTLTFRDYASDVTPTWCPGCGDFTVLRSLQGALSDLGKKHEDVAIISGIGCSSNLPHFANTYGMHTLHGRLLPIAMGTKLANPDLTVIGTGGDGDGYAIGAGHFAHAARRNVDMAYIVMDNQIYGLTTGQTSPTSLEGHETKSTPQGNIEPPFNPLAVALAQGATFVARGFSGDAKNLQETIRKAIEHPGFALVDTFSPCVTFNKFNTYQWYRQKIVNVNDPPEDSGLEPHDTSDRTKAFEYAMQWEPKIHYGILYEDDSKPTYGDQDPTLKQGHNPVQSVRPRDVRSIVDGMI